MRNILLLIFSLLVTVGRAQLVDNFSDGDFTGNPQWSGDVSSFIVNPSGELQLNATVAGSSYLSVPVVLSYSDTLEWRIKAHLAFAPSSANNARIYLLADTNIPQQILGGYFLQLGEALSNDAIELFRQTGTVITSVCRGPDAQIAGAFEIAIRVLRYPTGDWEIFSDENLAGNYVQIASGFDTGNPMPNYFVISCDYTSGNLQHFYYDDVYAGNYIQDRILPFCSSIFVSSDSTISLSFSEKLNHSLASQTLNYTIITIGNPVQLTIDSANDYRIELMYNQHFVSGTEYQLSLTNLQDVAGNRMNDTTINFTYYPIGSGNLNDVVISEVYFEMSSISPLPNAEFVELYNRSDSAINLQNWTISDGSSDGLFTDYLLKPKQYLVVYDLQNEQLFSAFSNRIGVAGFPGLNNDTGDTLTIKTDQNVVIETVSFNDNSYHDSNKKNGGWTVERVDVNFTCADELNWKASENSFHGTPGVANSVAGFYADNTVPFVRNVFLLDSTHVQVNFSEALFSIIIPTNFNSIDSDGGINDCISVSAVNDRNFVLGFSTVFSAGIHQLKILDTLSDCSGNIVDNSRLYRFGKAVKAEVGDVVINELLFDPFDGGEDFVELYNCSPHIIDLHHWTIQETDYEEESDVKDETLLSADHQIIFPGEFLVFTRSLKSLLSNYFCPNPTAILELKDLPDYNADEGRALVRDDFGNKIDGFQYSDKLHFYLLNSPKGVSLERLNGYSGNIENVQWHSAAASVGFATPAYKNSQSLTFEESDAVIDIPEEVFSPDNDGYHDLLAINYTFENLGAIVSFLILDKDGTTIRTLAQNETFANEGQIFWDGFSDDGKMVLPGRYLVFVKTFYLEGKSSVYRKSCVVAVKGG